MNTVRFLLSFCLLFQISTAVSAEPTLLSADKIPHLSIFQEIVDSGIVKIGNLDLRQIIEEAKDLKVYLIPDEPITVANQERKSAKYSVSDKDVFLNKKVITSFLGSKQSDNNLDPTMFLHEYVGSLGYVDHDYQLSSVLSLTHLLTQLAPLRPHYAAKLEVWKQYLSKLSFKKRPSPPSQPQVDGGSTTTEGGGDYSPALFKYTILYYLMFEGDNLYRFKTKELSILRFILNLKIEVDWKTQWTASQNAKMRTSGGRWTLWLPVSFPIESIVLKNNSNHPEFILEEVIRPGIEAQSKKGTRGNSCHTLLNHF